MKFNSLKFEISILYTAILGLILIIFSGVIYFIANAFLEQTDQQLRIKAQAVDLTIRSYLNVLGENHDALQEAVEKTIGMKNESFLQYKTWKISQRWIKQAHALNLYGDYINFINIGSKEFYSSNNLGNNLKTTFLEGVQLPSRESFTIWTVNVNHKNIRVINYPFRNKIPGKYLIQIGVAQELFVEQLRNWLYSISISVPLILILTNFVGRILATRILKPVYEITNMANQITQHDLSARIKTKHFGREMGGLIHSFNEMIARLEKSFKHIEQFGYHVAHELKTPLTIIQGEADLLLRKERTKHEYQQALRIIMEESQRVMKTIDDLLLMTKLGYQPEVFKFIQFDFIEFFNEIVEQNRLLAANKGIGIRTNLQNISRPLLTTGDRLHLRRLFFNILDNAIKFSPEDGCVDMSIEYVSGKIITSISDTGPGIAPENLKMIFDEFYRADKSKPGSGLGLNIAYSIAKIHHGDIQVVSQLSHGTTFKIILPSSHPLQPEIEETLLSLDKINI